MAQAERMSLSQRAPERSDVLLLQIGDCRPQRLLLVATVEHLGARDPRLPFDAANRDSRTGVG